MIWLSILALQALMMIFDEFYFHQQRGLPRWERVGHPLDTLSFLVCCGIALTPIENREAFFWFSVASVISCGLITKDSWVHQQECSGTETWLHSLLFLVHPLSLISLWQVRLNQLPSLLWIESICVGIFLSFQIFYWNTKWFSPKKKSIMPSMMN